MRSQSLVLLLLSVPFVCGDTNGTLFHTFTDQSSLENLQLITASENANKSMKACSTECLSYPACDIAVRNSTACYLFGITGLSFQQPSVAATPQGEENQLILKAPLCSMLMGYRYILNVKLIEAVQSVSESQTVQNVRTEDECYQACKDLLDDCQLFSYEKDTKNCTISSGDFYHTWTHAEARNHTVSCFKHQSGEYKLFYRRPKLVQTGHTYELVRMGLYKDGSEAKFAEFNGIDSSIADWMSIDKLMDSSWTDLGVGQTYLTVSMTDTDVDGRAPYLCRIHSGCPGDKIWFCGLETPRPTGCEWEKYLSWNTTVLPRFLYSTLDVASVAADSETAEADVMTFHVSFQ